MGEAIPRVGGCGAVGGISVWSNGDGVFIFFGRGRRPTLQAPTVELRPGGSGAYPDQ